MITFKNGNLLDDDADALVCPVNCVGVAGAGLAKAFANKFFGYTWHYKWTCSIRGIEPGQVTYYDVEDGPTIASFATKDHWKDPSDYDWISWGVLELVRLCKFRAIESIAIPMLGCGNGGLDWKVVRPTIVEAFKTYPDIDVRIYGPEND